MYTWCKIAQGRKAARLRQQQSVSYLDLKKRPILVRHSSVEKCIVGKTVGNRNQRKRVQNDETYDGMCEKCCVAGRGNIEARSYFGRSCTGMYVVT